MRPRSPDAAGGLDAILAEFNNSVQVAAKITELSVGGLNTFTSTEPFRIQGPISCELGTTSEFILLTAAMEVNITSANEALAQVPIIEKLSFVMNVTSAQLKGWIDLVLEKPHNAEGRSSLRPDCYPAAIKNFSIPQLWINMVAEDVAFSAMSDAGDGSLQRDLDQARTVKHTPPQRSVCCI